MWGNGWSAGGREPAQVVPGHDWHILRSQEMLCTAPAVIKCYCSPAASPSITHSPLTLQPLTYLPVCHVHSHAPSWKHPTYPQTHTHILPHLQLTLTTYSHIQTATSQSQLHTHTLNLPIFQHMYSLNTHPQIHTQIPSPTKIHPHRYSHIYPSRPRTLPIPHAFYPAPKQTISYRTGRNVPLLCTIISSAPSRVASMYHTINICEMINKTPHIIYLYPQDAPPHNLQKPPNTQNSHILTSRSHSQTLSFPKHTHPNIDLLMPQYIYPFSIIHTSTAQHAHASQTYHIQNPSMPNTHQHETHTNTHIHISTTNPT